jgi:hypothetical protein
MSNLVERRRREYAGVVEQHVYPTEPRNCGVHQALTGFRPAYVPCDIGNVLARRVYRCGGFRQQVFSSSVEDDLGASRTETMRGVRSDTRAASSDEHDFVFEAHIFSSLLHVSSDPARRRLSAVSTERARPNGL